MGVRSDGIFVLTGIRSIRISFTWAFVLMGYWDFVLKGRNPKITLKNSYIRFFFQITTES